MHLLSNQDVESMTYVTVDTILVQIYLVAVYGITGKPGILDITLYGISGIHGSRYHPLLLPLPDAGIAGTLYHHPSHAA